MIQALKINKEKRTLLKKKVWLEYKSNILTLYLLINKLREMIKKKSHWVRLIQQDIENEII